MCRSVFRDKAIAHPQIAFRFSVDGDLKLFLASTDRLRRIHDAYLHSIVESMLDYGEHAGTDLKIFVAAGKPGFLRRDRKLIQIFVNRRRIYEYSLIQAVQAGYSGFVPGGQYPVCFVFIEILPSLVDFNVHPAKNEVRFRSLPQIHHEIVTVLKDILKKYHISVPHAPGRVESSLPNGESLRGFQHPLQYPVDRRNQQNSESAFSSSSMTTEKMHERHGRFRYLGQLFGVFLLTELEGTMYIVDQHAAHERILYNDLLKGELHQQDLLFPVSFEASEGEAHFIRSVRKDLQKIGIQVNEGAVGTFEIVSLPLEFQALAEKEIVALLKNEQGRFNDLRHTLFQMTACKAAVKEGEEIDNLTAHELLDHVFALDDARCPHGRPIWTAVSRNELYRKVRRDTT